MAVLAISCVLPMGSRSQNRVYRIDVRVFEILPIQSETIGGSDGKGGIAGKTIGGNVTADFPLRPVVVQTEFGREAHDEDLKSVLYERGYLHRASLPHGVFWSEAGAYSISCPERDFGIESGRKEYHEPAVRSTWATHKKSHSEFWLTISPMSVDGREAVLNIAFSGGFANSLLFDQEVQLPLGKTTIVGFRQLATGGLVYILAICVQSQ